MSRKIPRKSKHYRDDRLLQALGEHCRKLRVQRGYSIDRMAKEAQQLSTSVIHRLEVGSGPVTVSALWRYAQVLGVSLKQLVDFPLATPSPEHAEERPALEVLDPEDPRVRKGAFRTLLPLYSVQAAAGYFGRGEAVEPDGWIQSASLGKLSPDLFVIRISGHSMRPRISDGDYGVFRRAPSGTRQGKIVLAQYRGPADPDTGGSFTVKKYTSLKRAASGGQWRHAEIRLSPLNPEYEPIVIPPEQASHFSVIAEFVDVLE